MMTRQMAKRAVLVLPIGLLLLSVVAQAGSISNVIFRIEATNAGGTGSLEFYKSSLTYIPATNVWSWSTGLLEIENPSGDVIAILDSANVSFVKDPVLTKPWRIDLGFALHAGTTDTHFRIVAGQVSFPSLPVALLVGPNGGGRSVASFGITDLNGNGAALQGWGPPGTGAYTAQYNGFVPNGTTFANLINLVSAGSGGGGSASGTEPPTGYKTIPADPNDPTAWVSDMSLQLDFSLTASDSANGTESFRILPEPAAGLGLLALGALACRRRRNC